MEKPFYILIHTYSVAVPTAKSIMYNKLSLSLLESVDGRKLLSLSL